MNAILLVNSIFFLFAVLGAVDYLLGNRFGIGSQFERGICCTGKLIIAMTGFMSLAPILGRFLTPLVSPFFTALTADPSAFAAMLLADDSGGASLAAQMALDPAAGAFNGYIVASMLGGAVMCSIPMTMLSVHEENMPAAVYGLIIGIFSVPFGCVIGGLTAGYRMSLMLHNLIPAVMLSTLLFLALLFFKQRVVRPFQMFGNFLVTVSLTGLLLTMARELLGMTPFPDLTPFSEVISVIGNIALVLSGVFPLMAVLMRLLKHPIAAIAQKLQLKEYDLSGLLTTSVNLFPLFDMLNDMTPRGVLLNTAFVVGANCMFGDHFAFTLQMRSDLVFSVMLAKGAAGLLSLIVALALAPVLLKNQQHR